MSGGNNGIEKNVEVVSIPAVAAENGDWDTKFYGFTDNSFQIGSWVFLPVMVVKVGGNLMAFVD
jgi:hypothetical protein